ncbi:MAG: hypothetical protein V4733_10245 [Verrucomicrobiota bacterium]
MNKRPKPPATNRIMHCVHDADTIPFGQKLMLMVPKTVRTKTLIVGEPHAFHPIFDFGNPRQITKRCDPDVVAYNLAIEQTLSAARTGFHFHSGRRD